MLDTVPEISCVNQSTPVLPRSSIDVENSAVRVNNHLRVSKSQSQIVTPEPDGKMNANLGVIDQSVAEVSSSSDKIKKVVRFSNSTEHDYNLSKLIHNHMLRTSMVYRERHSKDVENNCGAKRCFCVPRPVIIGLLSLVLCIGVVGMTIGVLHSQGIIKSPLTDFDTASSSISPGNLRFYSSDASVVTTESVFVKSVSRDNNFVTTPLTNEGLEFKPRLDNIIHLLTIEGPLQRYSYKYPV